MATKAKSSPKTKEIDAISMLVEQHHEVDELFEQIEDADEPAEKQRLFEQLADSLAMHTAIEEKHFYPAVREKRTEDILMESLEEHLQAKRILADLLKVKPTDPVFEAKMKVLQEEIEHHVEEEESELFPKVKRIMNKDELIALAQEMEATQAEMEGHQPRLHIPAETKSAAPLTSHP